MPKYLIEREIPGAGKLSPQELQAISQKSCSVLKNLGPSIQWVQSYVTGDKIYCVYIAPDETMVREHAKQGCGQSVRTNITFMFTRYATILPPSIMTFWS